MDTNLPNQTSSNPNPLPWKILLAVVVILLLLSASTNVYLYTSLQKQKAISQSTPSLPFSISDTSISMAGIAYKLQGTAWGVSQKKENYEVILQGKDGKLYKNQPLIFKQTILKTATSSAVSRSLKTGDSILLNYYFDLLNKKGYVTSVEITK